MKRLVLPCVLAALCCSAANSQTAVAYDAGGRVLDSMPFIWISQGRAGVPIRLLESLGFAVHYEPAEHSVTVRRPDSDYFVRFEPFTNLAYVNRPEGFSGYVEYAYQAATYRAGRSYVAARIIEELFPGQIALTYDGARNVVAVAQSWLWRPPPTLSEVRQGG